jgi:DNA-binding transcriptional LysR family regulator
VAIRSFLEKRTDLVQEYIAESSLSLYGSKEYLNRFGKPKELNDLDKHHLLAYGGQADHPVGPVDWHLTAGLEKGKMRIPVFTSNSSSNLFKAAEAGIGLVVLPTGYPLLKGSSLETVLPEEGPRPKFYCIYPKHLQEYKRIKVFVNFLKECYEKFSES